METETAAAIAESSSETIECTAARIELFGDWYDDPLRYFEEALQAKDEFLANLLSDRNLA